MGCPTKRVENQQGAYKWKDVVTLEWLIQHEGVSYVGAWVDSYDLATWMSRSSKITKGN